MDHDRVLVELDALPAAFAAVLLRAAIGPLDLIRLQEAIERKVAEVRGYVTRPASERARSSQRPLSAPSRPAA